MGAAARLVRFTGGGLVGAMLGGAAAFLLAPESGEDLRHRLRERLRQVRLAGLEAQAAKTEELVRRFRDTVDDPQALTETEIDAREKIALASADSAPAAAPVAIAPEQGGPQ